MAITILDTPQVSNDTSPPEKFTPALVAEDDSFMADLARPAIEAEAKEQEDLEVWRNDTLQKVDDATLNFDGFFPEKSPEVRRRMVVQAAIEAELGWSSSSSSQFEIDRPQAAMRIFGEDVGQTDESFVQALTKRATGRKEERDLQKTLANEAAMSVLTGWSKFDASWGEAAKNDPAFQKDPVAAVKNFEAFKKSFEEEYDDVLPAVRQLRDLINNDDTGSAVEIIDDMEPEEFSKAAKLLAFLQKNEGEVDSDRGIGGNLAESTGRDSERLGGKFKEGFLDMLSGITAGSTGADYVADDMEYRDKVNGFLAEVRRFRDQRDPIKLLSPEDSFWIKGAEKALYATPGVGMTVLGSAAPGGAVATMGLLIESAQEDYYLRAVDAGVERGEANKLAGSVAVPIAALQFLPERIGIGAVTKKLPGLSVALNKFNSKIVRVTSGGLIRGGAETFTEEVQAIIQEAGNDALNELKAEIPGADWDAHWSNFGERNLVTFLSIAPYSAMGSMVHDRGVSKSIEFANEATEEELVASGHKRSVVQKFQKAETEQEKRDAFFEMVDSQDPEREETKEAAKNLAALQEKVRETQEDARRLAISPGVRMAPDQEGYEVYDVKSGETMAQVDTAQEAAETVFSVFGVKESQRQAEFDEMLSKFEAGRLDVDQSGEMVEIESRTFTEADAMVELPGSDQRIQTERMLIEQRDGGTGEVTEEVMGQGATISGVFIPAGQMGRKQAATKLFNGSSVLTLIHERGHAKRRKLIDSGKWSRSQQVGSIKALDSMLGESERFLKANFDQMTEADQEVALDEAVAELAEVLALRTRKGGKSKMRGLINKNLSAMVRSRVPGAAQLSAFLKGLRDFFGLALKRAAVLKKAERDGKLNSAQVDALADMLVGVTPQEQFEAERDAVPTQMVDGKEVDTPFSLSGWSAFNYGRVLPRDFFNEAKVIGMAGKLVSAYNEGKLPKGFQVFVSDIPKVGLTEDGDLFLDGFEGYFDGTPITLTIPYNSGKTDRFPLQATAEEIDVWSVSVFDEEGNLDEEFTEAFDVGPVKPETPIELPDIWKDSQDFLNNLGRVGLKYVDRQLDDEFDLDVADFESGFEIEDDGRNLTAGNLSSTLRGKDLEFFFDKEDRSLYFEYEGNTGSVFQGGDLSSDFSELVGFKDGSPSFSITPAQDQAYIQAVESGDMDTAQRMVDEAAKAAGYDVGPVYHGTDSKEKFTVFDKAKQGKNWRPELGDGFYFGATPQFARGFGRERVIAAYLRMENPLVWERSNGQEYFDFTEEFDRINPTEFAKKVQRLGHDGLVANDGQTVVFNPNQIKSADPVTYDESGNVIPLSKRFDETRTEISFSLGNLDTAYLSAVESGDMETAQEMVNEAAKASGFPLKKFYHGTNADFDEFAIEENMPLDQAAFFSESKNLADSYMMDKDGHRIVTAFLKYENPAQVGEVENDVTIDELWQRVGLDLDTLPESEKDNQGDFEQAVWIHYATNPDIIKTFKGQGFDSIEGIEQGSKMVAVFNPNQIKSADPVTYDEAGNVIPLSERFNEQDDRISYQIGDSRMLSSLSENAKARTKRPEARAQIFGEIVERLAKLKRDVAKVIKVAGRDVEQKEIVDARTMKSLRKEATFRQALKQEELEEEILKREGQALQSGDAPTLKEMPVHGFIANVGKGFAGGAMESRSAFRKRTGRAPGAEYEGSEGMVGGLLYGGLRSPDQMAQELHSEGLLPDDSPATMWATLASERESVATQKEDFKAAMAKMRGAKAEAKKFADEWLADAVAKQERDYNPQERTRRALVMYDAILKALPPELRGKMGGFVKLSSIKTDEARLKFLEGRMEKADEIIEKWIQKEMTKEAKKLIKSGMATIETGEIDRGTKGATVHRLFEVIDEVFRGKTEAEAAIAGMEKEQQIREESGQLTAEWAGYYDVAPALVEAFGDWKKQSAAEMTNAVENAARFYDRGWLQTKIKAAQRAEMINAALENLRNGKTNDEIDEALTKADEAIGALWDTTKGAGREFIDFEQFLISTFGRVKVVEQLVDREYEAYRDREEMRVTREHEEAQFYADFFDGDKVKGYRYKHDLKTKRVKVEPWGSKGVPSSMTKSQIMHWLMMYRQPDGRRHFEGDGERWSISPEFMERLAEKLDERDIAVMDYYSDQYASEWEIVNPIHEEVRGATLVKNEEYSPITVAARMTSLSALAGATMDPLSGEQVGAMNATPSMFKRRSKTAVAKPRVEGAIETFQIHKTQVEHWVATAEMARDLRALFGRREARELVEAKSGKTGLGQLQKWIEDIATQGIRDTSVGMAFWATIDRAISRVSRMALFGKISTVVIQASQVAGAAAQMPARTYMAKLMKVATFQLDLSVAWNSPYIRGRLADTLPMVRLAYSNARTKKPTTLSYYSDRLGQAIGLMDAFFTAGTYAAIFDHVKAEIMEEQGLTGSKLIEAAHKEAGKRTERVAQPIRKGRRSLIENRAQGNVPLRAIFAFASEPRQKLGSAFWEMFHAVRSRDKVKNALVYGAGFAIVSTVIRAMIADLRDEGEDDEVFDEENWNAEKMMVKSMTDNFNGVPIVGPMAESGFLNLAKKVGFDTPPNFPNEGLMQDPTKAIPASQRLVTFESMENSHQFAKDVRKTLHAAGMVREEAATAAVFWNMVEEAIRVMPVVESD